MAHVQPGFPWLEQYKHRTQWRNGVFTFKTRAGFAKVSRSTEQLLMTTDKKNIVLRD